MPVRTTPLIADAGCVPDIAIVSIKVHQEPCAPEEPENSNCEAGTGDTEPTDDEQMETEAEPIETDAVPIDTGAVPTEADVPIETGAEPIAIDAEEYGEMIEGPQEPPPPLEWYLGISENLKVIQEGWCQLDLFDFVSRSLSNHFRSRRRVGQKQQTSGLFGN